MVLLVGSIAVAVILLTILQLLGRRAKPKLLQGKPQTIRRS